MKWLISGFLCVFSATIVCTALFLSPNDLKDCASTPSAMQNSLCSRADAIVAISGGDTGARAAEAIKLYQNGWAPRLIFSGAAQDTTGPSNAQAMRQQALAAGVPDDAILIEETSRTTTENAQKTRVLLTSQSIKRIILVTSAYHQRRASMEFNKQLTGQVKVINHPVLADAHWSPVWWLTLRGWWLAGSEVVKITISHFGGSF